MYWRKKFKRVKSLFLKKRLSRWTRLQSWMTGRKFYVHNGKIWQPLEVVRLRLQKSAGEFVYTRSMPIHKRKRRK